MDRNEFLANHWSKYPVLPEGFKPFRVALNQNGKLELLCPLDGSKATLDFGASDWARILVQGDLVAISEGQSDWILLAPNLRVDSHLNFLKPSCEPDVSKNWSDFLAQTKSFFRQRDFLEVETPVLVESPGTEPYLHFFQTELHAHGQTRKKFLPTSPELHLKKLVCSDWKNIFEVQKCFRNGEVSPTHQPEFHMLEWYRSYSSLDPIFEDVIELVKASAKNLKSTVSLKTIHRTSMAELFCEFLQFELRPTTSHEALFDLSVKKSIGYKPSQSDSWDELFFALFLEHIEPQLKRCDIVGIHPFPPQLCALARLTEDGWADRLEVYLHGVELANGFHELNDPLENRNRLKAEQKRAIEIGKTAPPIDEDFLRYLDQGMPPASGIALGLDRLFQVLMRIEDIRNTRPFGI